MQASKQASPRPSILNKQIILTLFQFTPISALLSMTGVILSLMVQPATPLPFLALITPLYINTHSYAFGISIVVAALVWPAWGQGQGFGWGGLAIGEVGVRVMLVINALYMMSSTNRVQRYRVLPSVVPNQAIPILL